MTKTRSVVKKEQEKIVLRSGTEISKEMKRKFSPSPHLELTPLNDSLINTPPKRRRFSPRKSPNQQNITEHDEAEVDFICLTKTGTEDCLQHINDTSEEVIFKTNNFYNRSKVNDTKQQLKKNHLSIYHSLKNLKRKTVQPKNKKGKKRKPHPINKKKYKCDELSIKMEKYSICEDRTVSPKFQYKPKYEKSPVSDQKKKKFFTHRSPMNSSPSKLPKIIMKLGHRRLSMPFKINSEIKKKLEESPPVEKKKKRLKTPVTPLSIINDDKTVDNNASLDSSSDDEIVLISRYDGPISSPIQSPTPVEKQPLVTPFTLSKNRNIQNLSPDRVNCNIAASPSSTKTFEKSTPVRFRKKKADGFEQLIIDAGQKEVGAVSCNICGMIFTACDEEDNSAHINYHNKIMFHLRFQGWKKERVLKEFHDGRIISIHPEDASYAQQKLEEILSVVDSDLGFSDVGIRNKSKCKFYLFISCEKRVVGCLIAELITQANRIIEDHSQANVLTSENPRTWCCKTETEKAICGISRIWTLASHRRQQIATRLVDCTRENFVYGYVLSVNDIAFSDPTPHGRLFAASYTKMPTFLVYK